MLGINVKKFELNSNTFDKPISILIIGIRGTGKTELIKDMLHKTSILPTIFNADCERNDYSKLTTKNIHYEFTPKIINDISQRKLIDVKLKIADKDVIVFDDIFFDVLPNNHCIDNLFLQNRHYKTSLIISVQHPSSVPITIRENTDYIFILGNTQLDFRKHIYDNYVQVYDSTNQISFSEFCNILDELTLVDKHICLVIDKTLSVSTIQERIFWYKARM